MEKKTASTGMTAFRPARSLSAKKSIASASIVAAGASPSMNDWQQREIEPTVSGLLQKPANDAGVAERVEQGLAFVDAKLPEVFQRCRQRAEGTRFLSDTGDGSAHLNAPLPRVMRILFILSTLLCFWPISSVADSWI